MLAKHQKGVLRWRCVHACQLLYMWTIYPGATRINPLWTWEITRSDRMVQNIPTKKLQWKMLMLRCSLSLLEMLVPSLEHGKCLQQIAVAPSSILLFHSKPHWPYPSCSTNKKYTNYRSRLTELLIPGSKHSLYLYGREHESILWDKLWYHFWPFNECYTCTSLLLCQSGLDGATITVMQFSIEINSLWKRSTGSLLMAKGAFETANCSPRNLPFA